MPLVPSPEPGGFVRVGHATNKDLKKIYIYILKLRDIYIEKNPADGSLKI